MYAKVKAPRILLWAWAIALLALVGCNLPAPEPPPCSAAELQPVTALTPVMYEMTDLQPRLSWTYPAEDCRPTGYQLTLYSGPDFGTSVRYDLPAEANSWTPPSPLEPARPYAWTITPLVEGEPGLTAGYFYFFTGPRCDAAADMLPPQLLWPEEGGLFDPAHDPGLLWQNVNDCQPDGYRIDVASDPAFPDEGLNGGTGNPGTRWVPSAALTACQTYYWRVAGVMDSGTSTVIGPYSETRSFVAAPPGEDCTGGGEVNMPPANAIRGLVWHDLCALPEGGTPDPLPEGCVADAGGAHADGIRQGDEPGIEGVEVQLYEASCSGDPLATALTDENGIFEVIAPGPGAYCLVIDALASPNDEVLLPGSWTAPEVRPAGLIQQTVALTASSAAGFDFGWDYQRLPIPVGAWFHFTVNAFCRKGPGVAYPDLTAIPAGETLAVLARNPQGDWYFVEWPQYDARCWVAASTGEFQGLPDDLIIYTPVPLPPTATPTPADAAGPEIYDVRALDSRLYHTYPNCGDTVLDVGARISDPAGVDETNTFLRYRFVKKDGTVSDWAHTPIHDHAMGNQVGFSVDIAQPGGLFLGSADGRLEYQVIAQDTLGNRSHSAIASLPVYFCKK